MMMESKCTVAWLIIAIVRKDIQFCQVMRYYIVSVVTCGVY